MLQWPHNHPLNSCFIASWSLCQFLGLSFVPHDLWQFGHIDPGSGLFGILFLLYIKFNAIERRGLLFGLFLIGLFSWRFVVENYKYGQAAIDFEGGLTRGQQLSIPFVIMGIGFVVYSLVKKKPTDG